MDASEIKRRVSIAQVLEYYGSPPDSKGKFHCPFPQNHNNGDAKASGSVFEESAYCHAHDCLGEKGSDIFDLVGLKENLSSFPEKRGRVLEIFLPGTLNGNWKQKINSQQEVLRSYQWESINTQPGTQQPYIRFHLRMSQADPGKDPKFLWNTQADRTGAGTLKPAKMDLYQRQQVKKAQSIIVCAGERDADALNEWLKELGQYPDLVATCNHTGENSVKAESFTLLHTKERVWVIGDNDTTGKSYVEKVCAHLSRKVEYLYTLLCPSGFNDISEWKDGDGKAQDLKVLLDGAAPYKSNEGSEEEKKKKQKGVGLVKIMADLIRKQNFFAQDDGRLLYHYSGGVYRPMGKGFVEGAFQQWCEELQCTIDWSTHKAREIVEYIRVGAPTLWDAPPLDTLNLKNGLLNVATKELRPHDPNFLSPVQIPITYDPEAKCPAWEAFIDDVFPEDTQALGYEIPAYLMLPDNSQQKAFLLIGEGENGKSTYLRALSSFLGKTNTCAVSLHRLEEDKFSVQRLIGKLACIVPDLPSEHLSGSSTFKAITGSDDLEAERKFQDSFLFRPYTRMIFSANHFPQSKDSSQAFFRRWVVIPFHKTIPPEKRVPREKLDARLADPTELSGVLNKAIEAYAYMQTRGCFTQSEALQEALREFREQTDPVATWLDQQTEFKPGGCISKKDLLIKYNASATDQGRPPMTAHAFTKAVRRLRPTVKEGQRTFLGDSVRVFLGMSLKSTPGPQSSPPPSQVSRLSQVSSYLPIAGEPAPEERVVGEEDKSLNREKAVKGVKDVMPSEVSLLGDSLEVDPWS